MGKDQSLQECAGCLDQIFAPGAAAPVASSGALAGTLAATLLASACGTALQDCKNEKAEDDLRRIQERAVSLRRDLLALVERGAEAAEAVAISRRASRTDDRERLRALLFASEVPLRIAESCHALLNLALRALGRAGIKAIAEVGTGSALAFSGVVGGIVTSRAYLAGIPSGSGIGATVTRKRAERILREAEALRTQITDRVRQHLP